MVWANFVCFLLLLLSLSHRIKRAPCVLIDNGARPTRLSEESGKLDVFQRFPSSSAFSLTTFDLLPLL